MNDGDFQQLIRARRDEPAHLLQFAPCVERLLDGDLCESVVRIMQSLGVCWERYPAHDALDSQLPDERGVYMFVWRPRIAFAFSTSYQQSLPWILYVGKAGTAGGVADTLPVRYRTYRRYIGKSPSSLWDRIPPKTREERLSRYLTLRPLEYWFVTVEELDEIRRLEKHLIKLFRPPINDQHARCLRPGRARPAF
jgi:hypothetical protein